ncbi:MAG: hypothetical protein OXC99_02465 [Chloroflexi bacterium]|nr:hypothetical protein [Chloroflexota bacterium]
MKKKRLVTGTLALLLVVAVGMASALAWQATRTAPASVTEECDLNTYDTLATMAFPDRTVTWQVRHLKGDRHEVLTHTAPDGTLIGRGEKIYKDGMLYLRETLEENPEVYGAWRVNPSNIQGHPLLGCLAPPAAGASGHSDAPHYTTDTFLSEEEGSMRREVWVDVVGQPVRERRTFYGPDYDGVTNTDTTVMELTYKDHGEPNVIKAPCADAVPDQANNPSLMLDCIALLAAKDGLRGTGTLNWSVDVAIGSWDRVTTAGTPSRVTKLLMSNKGLNGSIPVELGRLSGLQELKLSGNALTGCIPIALKDVPTNDLASLNLLYCRPPAPDTP